MFVSAPNKRGDVGVVTSSSAQSGTLDAANKRSFPVEIFKIIRRQAEDLLLSNSADEAGRRGFEFIYSLAEERSDVGPIKQGQLNLTCEVPGISYYSSLSRIAPFSYIHENH